VIHLQIEAMKFAFADAHRYIADPKSMDIKPEQLLDPAYLAARAKELGVSEEKAEASFVKQFPIGRLVEPKDIAPIVLFLASPHASAITGQSIAVDGGSVPGISY
jgi:NAD(P)-dependent dehydrogenase (short-subunit alcohol dehydrogenase family)